MLALLRTAACAAVLTCAWQMTALADVGVPALTKADVDTWLDGFMPYALRQGDIAGAVIVVVKDGSVLTQRGYGYADLAARKPMDPERTLLRAESVSKLFTWTALMQLVERGKVALDADVNTYLERPFEIVGLAPAGALSASATDIAKFMIAHLQQGRLGDAVILQPQTAQQMHTTALTILPRVDRMLLGFYEANYKGRRVIAHGGDTQWFHGDLRLFIDDGVGMFVAVNSMGKGLAAIELRTALFEQFADRYLPVPGWNAGPGVDERTALSHAKLIAGHYTNSRRAQSSFMSLLNLVGSLEVTDHHDGTIGVSMVRSASGVPLPWREVEPFVWQLDGSPRLLSAELRNDKIVRIAFDEISPFMMFERMPAWKGSWLLPVFLVALISLLATAVAWPVSALTCRYYGAQYTQPQQDANAHRWLRIAAIATVLMWTAWAATIGIMMSDLENLSSSADGWLWVLHVLSVIVVLGGIAAGLWHAARVVRSQRRWYAKAWAVLLAIALTVSLWVAVAYNVIASGVNY